MKTKWVAGGLVLMLVIGVWGGLEAVKTAKQKPNSANANVVAANSSARPSANASTNSVQNAADSGANTGPLIDDQGGIEVGVVWNKANPGSTVQSFQIELNNHAVDVEGFDFVKNLVIKINGKEIPIQVKDVKKNGAGHHAAAQLTLESASFANLKKGDTLILMIKNVFNTPTRTFSWTY